MDSFLHTIQSIQNILNAQTDIKHIKNALKCLTDDYKLQLKINSLLLLIHLSQQDKIRNALNKDQLLYDFILKTCQNQQNALNQISLESLKYFGTVAQIDKYREAIDILMNEGIDLPNTYVFANQLFELQRNHQNREVLTLQSFQQIVYDHQIDLQGLTTIVQSISTIEEKHICMLDSFKSTTFVERISSIEDILKSDQSILTSEQLEQLKTIQSFEQQFNKQVNKQQKDKFKNFNQFLEWIAKQLNIKVSIKENQLPPQQNQQQNSVPILVIENQPSDRTAKSVRSTIVSEPQKNPFHEGEKALRQRVQFELEKFKRRQLPDKQYSGQLVQGYLNINQEDQNQLKKFKLSSIKNKQTLFDSPEIQLGVIKKFILKEELNCNFLELTFYIGNKRQKILDNCSMVFEEPRGLQFWVPQNKMDSQILGRKQCRMSCLIAYQYSLFEPLKGQFQWIEDDKVCEAVFMVPCLLSQFMNFLPIGRRYFKYIWKEKKLFCHRSEIFKLNEKVIKSVLDFKRYIPNLCYLVDLKDFLDDGKPQLKDLKLGGEFTLQDIRVRYWIKIIIRQNLDVVVKVIGMSDAIQIVKCLVFILKA
ncbi:unnamed protein product (macronuclear) [Paramecium tetraurelia]|uniref:Uncharacterized protein n=1 Tax=Paramecium tetraurelia TaxID=5888 RepID=A0CCT7_PARTE|nr:uncharacterized protein GSPATT00037389001 [Paramecium tetraurelia]CAK68604.1 unnamed protein product [Paramecium tetraurelia]|eukprot:XP_001436001.1 hypothetical protein (macronuclear) [Paramecium tetraurelia strain d4-2]